MTLTKTQTYVLERLKAGEGIKQISASIHNRYPQAASNIIRRLKLKYQAKTLFELGYKAAKSETL